MYFNDLPERLLDPVFKIQFDKDFQKRYAEDKILDHLLAQQFNASRMLNEWLCFKDIPIKVRKASI